MIDAGQDIAVWFEEDASYVATVEIRRPPHNHFDHALIAQIADAFEALDRDDRCRCIVLAAQGKAFCAGASFSSEADAAPITGDAHDPDQSKSAFRRNAQRLYGEAVRLFGTRKPVVGAIHGAAVGGGLGLALVSDLRVTCRQARFCANFALLGIHPGFGLSHTLPALIGPSKASLLFYTGRRVKGDEAVALGLADVLVAQDQVRNKAIELADEIAAAAPLAVVSVRRALREGLPARIRAATERELEQQERLLDTNDAREGMQAVNERRRGNFTAS